jgi:hypothetical protein
MKMSATTRRALKAGATGWLAMWLLDRFVIQYGPDDPSGFVMSRPGLGADDLATFLTFGAVGALTDKVL